MIRGVIFDMDGLMLDTEKLLARYWMQAAHEAGFPMELPHVWASAAWRHAMQSRNYRGSSGGILIMKPSAPAAES